MPDGLDVDLMLTGDLRYSVPPLFGYSKFTWRDGNGSHVMTYFCHAEKLSLGFSIYKYALSVFFCFFLSGSDDGIALGLWHCHLVIWFMSRDTDSGEQLSSWNAPQQKRRTEWRCFIKRGICSKVTPQQRTPTVSSFIVMNYCTFKS